MFLAILHYLYDENSCVGMGQGLHIGAGGAGGFVWIGYTEDMRQKGRGWSESTWF